MSRARLENPGGSLDVSSFVDSASIDFQDAGGGQITAVVTQSLLDQYALLAGRAGDILNMKFSASPTANETPIQVGVGDTVALSNTAGVRALVFAPTVTITTNAPASGLPYLTFSGQPIVQITNAAGDLDNPIMFNSAPQIQNPSNLTMTGNVGGPAESYRSNPRFDTATPGVAAIVVGYDHYVAESIGGFNAGWTMTTGPWRGYVMKQPAGAGNINTIVGFDMEDMGTRATNESISLRSQGASASLRHAGPGVFGANAAPSNASVGLEVQSTTQALLLPRMTTAQRDAMTPLDGMLIYNTTTAQPEKRIAGAWVAF